MSLKLPRNWDFNLKVEAAKIARSRSVMTGEQMAAFHPSSTPNPLERPIKMGWLKKQRSIVKNWQQRYFVLRAQQLYYYKDEEDTKPQVSSANLIAFLAMVVCENKRGCSEQLPQDPRCKLDVSGHPAQLVTHLELMSVEMEVWAWPEGAYSGRLTLEPSGVRTKSRERAACIYQEVQLRRSPQTQKKLGSLSLKSFQPHGTRIAWDRTPMSSWPAPRQRWRSGLNSSGELLAHPVEENTRVRRKEA
uniref:Rho GTPase activating protein 25 n=1 Tax=Papio anubis TaxID=9555 RepID=A0A8I5NBZ9_PAPAN